MGKRSRVRLRKRWRVDGLKKDLETLKVRRILGRQKNIDGIKKKEE